MKDPLDRRELGPGFYRKLIEQSRDIHTLLDSTGLVVYQSPSVTKVLGWEVEEMVGKPGFDFMHPEDLPRMLQEFASVISNPDAPLRTHVRMRSKDGTWVHLESMVRADFSNQDINGVHIVSRDVSAVQEVHSVLRNREHLLQTVVSHPNIILWAIDVHGMITVSEGEGLGSLGLQPGELVGLNVFDVYSEHPDVTGHLHRALKGETLEYTIEIPGADSELTVDTRLRPQFSKSGEVTGVTAISFEVTERVELESELRRAKTVEAIGMLAGGVAHDFNNLLTAIIGFANAAKNSEGEDDVRQDHLDQIMRAGHRGAELVGQLLSFARKDEIRPETVDLAALLTNSLATYRQVLGHSIEAVLDVDAMSFAKCHIRIDRSKLEQVFLNLVANARDAMPSGGTLRLSLVHEEDTEQKRCVKIVVRDTGEGMDQATAECVFDPFFSTKEQGTGLGLATTQSIVQRAGGTIRVESTVNGGTTFVLLFPCVSETGHSTSDESRGGERAGQGRILLVDDNAAVLQSTALTLEYFGFEVRTASSGQEGYDLFVQHRHEIDLVMTDMTMPGMKGDELAHLLRELDSELPIIFVSGYHDYSKSIGSLENVSMLSKPYKDDKLCDAIAALLDSGS